MYTPKPHCLWPPDMLHRIGSGCVTRERLQAWLTQECRPVLALLDGGTLMDLLERHTYGGGIM